MRATLAMRLLVGKRLHPAQRSLLHRSVCHGQPAAAERISPACLQNRQWLSKSPATQIKKISLDQGNSSFSLLQDDLLHPVLGGNKLRKLDALLPHLVSNGFTDVVTCGGLQSAHTAAVAAACAENGLAAHLLVRGERPAVPCGYHLLARMYGEVTYVSRTEYSDRTVMLETHASALQARKPQAKIHVIAEGAAEPLALLGLVRLVDYLAACSRLPPYQPHSIIVDSGTGTTATGLALGIAMLGLPWKVISVIVAADEAYHRNQTALLSNSFLEAFPASVAPEQISRHIDWVQRLRSRRFGKVFPEDIAVCCQVAKRHGVVVDPVYSLAAWEVATTLANGGELPGKQQQHSNANIIMLHTGGALGLQGIAQRLPGEF